jgi:predicted ArsR family transcriptional regulator
VNTRGPKSDVQERILAVLKDGAQMNPKALAERLRVSDSTINQHLCLLRRRHMVSLLRTGRNYTYFIGAAQHAPRREASVVFAGYRNIGRGLANWP